MPGGLSALGILVSDVVKDYSRTLVWRTSMANWEKKAVTQFAKLKHRAAQDFRRERWTGKIHFDETVDLRYHGQGYELNVPFGRNVLRTFHAEHRRRYGYSHEWREVEIVTLRLRARLASPTARWSAPAAIAHVRPERAPAFLDGKSQTVGVVDRASLAAGRRLRGPAVVTEYSATTWVPPEAKYHADVAGNLVIEL